MRLIKGRRGKGALLNTLIRGEGFKNRLAVSCHPQILYFPAPYCIITRWRDLDDLSNVIIELIKDNQPDVVYIYGQFRDDNVEWLKKVESMVSMLTVTINKDDGTDNITIEYM